MKVQITKAEFVQESDPLRLFFKCPACGSEEIQSTFKFCPMCGATLEMYVKENTHGELIETGTIQNA